MVRFSLLAAVGVLAFGLAGAVTPTFAASIASCQNEVNSDTTPRSAIDQDAAAILAGLRDKGVNALDVANWGGCVRADVVHKNGRVAMEFFDPASLQRLHVNGG
jgi:hypothetical protein